MRNSNVPIGTGARKHLVDAEHVERVDADAEVKRLLAGHLGHVLVDGNARRLERLGGQLLLLTRDEVNRDGELVDLRALLADVIDADLRVWQRSNASKIWAPKIHNDREGENRAQSRRQWEK